MNALLKARQSELLQEQDTLHVQLQIAHREREHWMTRNLDEFNHWDSRVRDLQSDLRMRQGQMRAVLEADERAHYGGREEEREGISNGAIRWEA